MEKVLPVQDYAKKKGVSASYIYLLIKEGKLKTEKKQCFVEHNGQKVPTGRPKTYVIFEE